jgi:membrane protease YdiL (CAAX protease family)
VTVAALSALAVTCIPQVYFLANTISEALSARGVESNLRAVFAAVFLFEGISLCLVSPRDCGLRIGEHSRWQLHLWKVAVFWALPPLAVLTVYAQTSKPFHGSSYHEWLFNSISQELFFSGFIYSRLVKLWGEPGESTRGAFALPMLVTPLLFAAWHWPNARALNTDYMAFMFAYTFIGGWWCLQMRRWTGSALPGIANHVAVNYLASVV